VCVSMPLFRDTLISLRRLMDETQQRSMAHGSERQPTLQAYAHG
jgi:hypothetical protein